MKGNEKRKGSNGRVKGERENGGSSREGREGKGKERSKKREK